MAAKPDVARGELSIDDLKRQLEETQQHQAATSELLEVIRRSSSDFQAVLDALMAAAARLCGVEAGGVAIREGEIFRYLATVGMNAEFDAVMRGRTYVPGRGTTVGRVALEKRVIHIVDVLTDPEYEMSETVTLGRLRTILSVPMMRDGDVVGAITLTRRQVEPFSEPQIALIKTFADQAVIAMENARLLTETREALEQQTATAEVLGVINTSPSDLAPVFEAMLDRAMRLCEAAFGALFLFDDDRFLLAASRGVPSEYRAFLTANTMLPGPGTAPYRFLRGGERSVIEETDLAQSDAYRAGDLQRRALVDIGGAHSAIQVPLCKDDTVLGAMTLYRQEVSAFTEKQVALLQNFAAQAVIAMENARLINETREALEQQTATADILRVISSSPADVQPTFDAIAASAARLCEAEFSAVARVEDGLLHLAATNNLSPEESSAFHSLFPRPPSRSFALGRAFVDGCAVQLNDVLAEADYDPHTREVLQSRLGYRTFMAVPIFRAGMPIGTVGCGRRQVKPFSAAQIQVLNTFAEQAAIALDNVRLFTQLRQRTDELSESLEQQTATANVLKVISRSTFDLQAVLDTLTESAARLCETEMAAIVRPKGEAYYWATSYGFPPEFTKYVMSYPLSPGRDTVVGRVLLDGAIAHVPDLLADPEFGFHKGRKLGDYRSVLGIPLVREGTLVGVLLLIRRRAQAFTDKQIDLATTFADQAVIAIENSRLLGELRESEARHALVSDAVAEGIYEWNIETNALWVSKRLIEIFGFEGRQLTAEDWNELVHPVDFPSYRNTLQDCFKGIARRFDCEYRVRHADGAYRWIEDRGVAVRDAAGRAVRLVGAVTDVTVRKESERALSEALEQQTATAEVLQVINSSPGNLTPVFETILEKAHDLCRVAYGSLQVYDGTQFRAVAVRGLPEPLAKRLREGYEPGPNHPVRRLLDGEDFVHIRDFAEINDPIARSAVEAGGMRTALFVALRNDRRLLGMIVAARREVRPFAGKETALLQGFAAQAVIAIENARLLTEQQEALEQQTATTEVLQVINSSPRDLAPVFDTMLDKATRLSEAAFGILWTYDGERFQAVAFQNVPPAYVDFLREPQLASPVAPLGRVARGEAFALVSDLAAEEYHERAGLLVRQGLSLGGFRTVLAVPLRKDASLLGAITIYRREVQPFSDKQIALLQAFAAQAVIAMENARLLEELRASLEQQTATSDVLKIISRSSVSLETVLDTLVETVAPLCRADQAFMFRREDESHRLLAACGLSDEAREFFDTHPMAADRSTMSGRVSLERRTVHIFDVLQDAEYSNNEGQKVAGFRTLLGIPLLRENILIGLFIVARTHVEPFLDKEIELATSFADQAVIAIENARLFEELRDRQAELRVTFDNMGDGVAMFDAEPRLAAWNRNFEEIIGLSRARLAERPSYADYLRLLAERGEFGTENVEAELASRLENTERELRLERTRADGTVIEVRRNAVPGGGFVLIYSDVTEQRRAEAEIRAARDAAEAALERQTATADILKVIASSPTDVQPVLDAVAKAAQRFCGATDAVISLREGDEFSRAAHEGSMPSVLGRSPLDRSSISGRSIFDGRTIHIPDIRSLDREDLPTSQTLAAQSGARAALAAPMLREGIAIGCIMLRKANAGSFAPTQIELLEAFAAQAVIAIENVRLFTELRESLEQQTATAEILRAISQSPTNVQPVLEAVAKSAVRFCGAQDAFIALEDGDSWVRAAHEGPIETQLGERVPLSRESVPGRAIIEGRTCHVADIEAADPRDFATLQALAVRYGFRAALGAPLLREGRAIGALTLRKDRAEAFTSQQIALLEGFAAQAVIAIENVRLFTELRESLEYQTATSEVLKIISRSTLDLQLALDTLVSTAARLCDAEMVLISRREDGQYRSAAITGFTPEFHAFLQSHPLTPGRGSVVGRVALEKRVIQIADVTVDAEYTLSQATTLSQQRTAVGVPLLRKDDLIGVIVLARRRVEPFTSRQIEIVRTFADQAVIAIENVRLFTELKESLERLKAAQANLIQSEKMASLGQLTAGIAHEIKNPLNFVNNFANLSVELLDELRQTAAPALDSLGQDRRAELDETMALLTGNLAKIAEHGRRADGIVKSMLAHSRGGSGDWQSSDINSLVEEALNLAYHGARAQDKDFNVTLERDFDKAPRPIDVVPQDVTRVFLNLFGNGFYAGRKRQREEKDSSYRPTLRISTRDVGEAIEVRVRDNGTGIQPEVRAKLFQPFFTTKPTGEGTGLGLSISYDIVTQQHGGTIEVESEPGSFTEFTVRLPRRRRAA